ncbi:hypothetical protein [Psychromonas sp.]|uniref:hypothetical protein n=1 Tax=Psychromonas sp. TaxID=1884585 RepID=UPI00356189F3
MNKILTPQEQSLVCYHPDGDIMKIMLSPHLLQASMALWLTLLPTDYFIIVR